MVIEKTNNLYENWVKKPEMIFIIEILNNINVFKTNQNLIYMIMIKTIYHNIYNHFNLLTTDKRFQLAFPVRLVIFDLFLFIIIFRRSCGVNIVLFATFL